VTIFTAYYDASGSEDDKDGVLVVVGLIANEYKWVRFEREWHAALEKFDVPYFHMKELGKDRKAGTGVYAKWKDDDVTPRLFVRRLLKVIRRQTNKMFCYGTILKDFRGVDETYRLHEEVGSPYVLTTASCYDLVNKWGRVNYPKDRGIHILEDGDCGQRDFLKLAKRMGQKPFTLPKINKETGEWFIPFQGADLIAGAYRHAANRRGTVRTFEDYGEVFTDIANKLAQKSLIYDRRTLVAMCKAQPDKFPKRV